MLVRESGATSYEQILTELSENVHNWPRSRGVKIGNVLDFRGNFDFWNIKAKGAVIYPDGPQWVLDPDEGAHPGGAGN